MSAADLKTDLDRLGIRIEAHGDRLRYSPRSAVTPDLAARMKAHKGELLAILRRDTEAPTIDLPDALFPPDDPEAGETDEAIEVIDPPDPCPKCGTLELWQSLAGDLFGRTPGRWRCVKCDPPTTARRIRELAARLKAAARVSTSGGASCL